MRNENEEIRALFDTLSPDEGQKERMKENIMGRKEKKMTKRLPVKYAAAAVLAAVLAGTGCVYAAVPAVREYINMLFLREDSVTRLTEVPEGWIGVYTAENLEAVRENLGGCYILMNDIVIPEEYYEPGGIYEDGFVPIGNDGARQVEVEWKSEDEYTKATYKRTYWEFDAFTGIFNGNGYTISNVRITDLKGQVAGLFGECMMQYDIWDPETGETYQKAGGIIKNLGVVDSSVIITDEKDYFTDASIGMIVGKGAFVVGCYTSNVQVQYSVTEAYDEPYMERNIAVGGVAGEAKVVDSCWSDADIRVDAHIPADLVNLYTAGVCGWSKSCVTSYFNGTIESPVGDWEVCYFDPTDPPEILNEAAMWEINYRLLCHDSGIELDREAMEGMHQLEMEAYLEETHGVKLEYPNPIDYDWFNAFYCGKLNIDPQDFLTYKVDDNVPEYVYLLDPTLKDRERNKLSEILSLVFEGDEFIEFCQQNGVKYGAYDNYDLRREPDCTFEGFDFTYIWKWGEDGLPKLRLFAYSTEDGVETYDSVTADMVRG